MAFIANIDACVLINAAIRDTILRAAESEQFALRVAFSEDILEETRRNLASTLDVSAENAQDLVDTIRESFEDGLVDGYESLIEVVENDPKDRHVLAAAVRVDAGVIVTFNMRHFPAEAYEKYAIEVQSPDEFLLELWNLNSPAMARLLMQQALDLKQPPVTLDELLARLSQDAPTFIEAVRSPGQWHYRCSYPANPPMHGRQPRHYAPRIAVAPVILPTKRVRTGKTTDGQAMVRQQHRRYEPGSLSRAAGY